MANPTKSLSLHLEAHLCKCPLGGQYFLPLDSLDETITTESVKAQLSWEDRTFRSGLPREVVQHAKKVFAILVLIGDPRAIKGLLGEGLTDEYLPLSPGDPYCSSLVSAHRDKTFQSPVTWDEFRVALFLEKQWVVQAPVLDTTGIHIALHPRCPLPFQSIDEVGWDESGRVYRGALHPAHQKGFKVSITLGFGSLTYIKVRAGSSTTSRH